MKIEKFTYQNRRDFKEDALVRIIETYAGFFTPLGVTV